MLEICNDFKAENEANLDPEGMLRAVRAKFRLCQSILKTHQSYQPNASLQF
ncbi:hypothetical protein HDV03_002028 [Kappamyces sp. JEL0829]|nr:hypothetical protein HDV03_002028 [Kappamyces sp. JEL0829]